MPLFGLRGRQALRGAGKKPVAIMESLEIAKLEKKEESTKENLTRN
jgi:hypothetical protein